MSEPNSRHVPIPKQMPAILLRQPGGPENLYLGEYETPQPGPEDILIRVGATALNRADTLQRQGKYPPPPGASPLLGLEAAGRVVACGSRCTRYRPGDAVMALLPGGGYAAYAAISERLAMPVPQDFSFAEAAAIPEVFLTAFQALAWLAQLQRGESLLIHAGASGVGTAAIQLAREMGAEVMVTASAGKHALCLELGARRAIDYRSEDFLDVVQILSDGRGVDVMLDFLAAPYFQRNLDALAMDGRLIMLALMGGSRTEGIKLAPILRKRLQIKGSTLRNRSLPYKAELTEAFMNFAHARFEDGRLKPVIDTVFDWEAVAEAHRYMEANKNSGKIILKVNAGA